MITKFKSDTTHNRRVVFSYLKSKEASSILFRDVAPKVNDRPGGYTRIIKLNNRLGDNAEMAMIELVDFNDLLTKDQAKKRKPEEEVVVRKQLLRLLHLNLTQKRKRMK